MRTCPLCPLFIATVLVAAPTAFLIAAAPTQDSTAPSKAAANTGKKAGEKEWAVHDMTRPEPAIVAGGTCTNGGCSAPSDAMATTGARSARRGGDELAGRRDSNDAATRAVCRRRARRVPCR